MSGSLFAKKSEWENGKPKVLAPLPHGKLNPNIQSQSSIAVRKGPEFYTTNCCMAAYVGKIAYLILKNVYRTENTLSGAGLCELLSDWSKTHFGFQDLVSGQ